MRSFPGENPFNKSNVQRDTRRKTLTRPQLIRVYLVMQQFEEAERVGRGIRGGRNALWPAWYWLTVLNAFRYTGMRLNQLLHIRLGDINLSEDIWISVWRAVRHTVNGGYPLSVR